MATMTQATTARKSSKGKRTLTIGERFGDVLNVLITDARGERCGYHIKPIAVDFGRGYQMDKFEAEQADEDESTYHVHLDAQTGDSCTCKGHIYRSTCKHVDALKTLLTLGKL